MFKRFLFAVVAAQPLIFAVSTHADILFYTDRATFQAASGPLTTESLDSITTTGGNTTVQPTGVTITGGGTGLFLLEAASSFISEGTGSLLTSSWDNGDTMTFDFATPITGFGIDFLDNSGPFDMDLSVGGSSQNYSSNQNQSNQIGGIGPLFLGVRDNMVPFSQVVITTNESNTAVNFDYIQFQSVPEPSAFLFGGLVSVVAGCTSWMKRRQGRS